MEGFAINQPVQGKFGIIILAGGKSSRFGRDKSLLTVDGLTISANNLRCLGDLFAEQIIVSNTGHKFSLPGTIEITDIYKDSGPMGGLHAGLSIAGCDYNLLLACDMPQLDRKIVEKLLQQAAAGDADIVAARHLGKVEPLCTVYHRRCLDTATKLLEQGRRSMMALMDSCSTEFVEIEHELFNINFPEDAQLFFSNMQKKIR